MSPNSTLALASAVLFVLAVLVVVTTSRRSDTRRAVGALSRETRRRDRVSATADWDRSPAVVAAHDVRSRASRPGRAVGLIERGPERAPVPFVLADADAVAFTRRQFFNRANTAFLAVGLGGFGAAVVAFLWPRLTGGAFGSKIRVGTITEVRQQIQDNRGFWYVPQGRMWITEYPAAAVPRAEKAYPPVVVDAMRAGFVALYQKCPHLGCRVPECLSSQWFECPCHGSQYNRAGEKKAGPAPRGMDHFALTVAGGAVSVDTSRVIPGPPIGTNTTGQEAEGPHCVGSAGGE